MDTCPDLTSLPITAFLSPPESSSGSVVNDTGLEGSDGAATVESPLDTCATVSGGGSSNTKFLSYEPTEHADSWCADVVTLGIGPLATPVEFSSPSSLDVNSLWECPICHLGVTWLKGRWAVHLKTHRHLWAGAVSKNDKIQWCIGVPYEYRDKYGVFEEGPCYEYGGQRRIGGCLLGFRSKKALFMHLCYGEFGCVPLGVSWRISRMALAQRVTGSLASDLCSGRSGEGVVVAQKDLVRADRLEDRLLDSEILVVGPLMIPVEFLSPPSPLSVDRDVVYECPVCHLDVKSSNGRWASHLHTHRHLWDRSDPSANTLLKWCIGVPYEHRAKYGVSRDMVSYHHCGRTRIAGCLLAFRTKDALDKHLCHADFGCLSLDAVSFTDGDEDEGGTYLVQSADSSYNPSPGS